MDSSFSKYEQLEVSDASYDPAGGTIASYSWEVYKGSELIYTGSTPKTDYLNEGIGEYTIYLQVTNDRGTVSEKFGRTFTVTDDEIAPEVVVLPVSSDWVQSKTVHLDFTDDGGSGFKYYKYAITDSQSTPETWSDAISNISDDISITGTGARYLHIIAEDNAGNTSNDRITGPYYIDNIDPEITVSGDLETEVLDSLVLQIQSSDDLSGIKSVLINGVSISTDALCEFFKNGTYIVEAEDNVGNIQTETIEITNIYYECTNNLGHPHYSSTYDNCPICSEFEGLSISSDTKVYNGELQGISYDNPSEATIIEYYNNSEEKVKNQLP